MAATVVQALREDGFARWSPDGHDLTIDYSIEVLDSIRAAAVEGLHRFRRGGVEIGGVLYGTRTGNTIRVVKSRALQSEYAQGPSFTLSETDEQHLERLLQQSGADAELGGGEIVGWYHSHTRSGVCLTARDVALYDRYFPQAWQIAMVLRPWQLGSAELGFFFREHSGSLRTEAPYETLTLFPAQPKPPATEPARAAVAVLPIAPPPSFGIARKSKPGWIWLFVALILAALAAWIVTGLRQTTLPLTGNRSTLDLRAVDSDGEVRIEWKRDADFVLASSKASVFISDGGEQMETALGPEMLHNGRLVYYRNSSDVEIRMLVYRSDGGATQELTRLIGLPSISRRTPTAPASVRAPDVPLVRESRYRPVKAKEGKVTAPAPARTPDPATEALKRILPPPVEVKDTSALAVSLPAPVVPIPVEVPTKEAPIPRTASVYRGPTSGRLIWTGAMAPHSTILIDGDHASLGDLTGKLPDAPTRIGAYPASFSGGKMTVYARDLPNEKQTTELPGPGNGWLPTVYTLDLNRAAGLTVREFPSAGNNWKKIVLQSGDRDISVIVIDWRVSQPER